MAPIKTRSTASKHRQDRGYKADPEDTNDDEDFYGMRELKHQLAGLNLQLKDTMGDGNCLFRACADQFFGNENDHSSLRAEVCQYIEQHSDHFKSFLDNETVEAHVSKMRKNGTYGGNIELVAFARMKLVDIKVYQPGYIFVIEGVDVKKEGSSPGQRPVMHIAYHSWEHYSSIRNIDGPHEGLPEINPRSIKQKPLAKLTNQDPPRSIERMIMNVTGTQDLELVRELLEKHHGNVDSVYNEIYGKINPSDNEDEQQQQQPTDTQDEQIESKSKDSTPKSDASQDRTNLQDTLHDEHQGSSDVNDEGKDTDNKDVISKKDTGNSNDSTNTESSTSNTPPPPSIEPSLDEPTTKVVIPKKRISSREKKELAKRNQKLNKKNRGKAESSSSGSSNNSNGNNLNDGKQKSLSTKEGGNPDSNMRELFV
ncbi:hypothetical protein BGZ46_005105 [Entomortierella lignicola]|nr:hypothetical protein BGZ46_005105 [Entomortierella lignicola]